MTTRRLDVLIIGGGLAGLCLAQGLRRAGVGVTVFERDRSRTDRLEGYRIHIDPDGASALRACLPPEVWEAFLDEAVDLGSFTFLDERLRPLAVLEDGGHSDGTGHTDHSRAIDRVVLRELLLAGLEDVVQFDKTFERYELTADGKVTAHFADGTSATGDVLVGADGAASRVRRQYLPQARREDTGAVGIGLKLPLTDQVRSWLPPGLASGRSMIIAPAPYFLSISVFDYRSRPAGRHGSPEEGASEPRPTLLVDPAVVSESYLGCAFVARRDACPPGIQNLGGRELQRVVESMVAGWHPMLRRVVAESDPESALLVPYLTSVPPEPWESTNVTLIGDAIHSMPPVGGLGGNTALRDADLLRRMLIAVQNDEMPLLAAIQSYEAEMREYGFAAVRKALWYQRQGLRSNRIAVAASRMGFRILNALMHRRRRAGASPARGRFASRRA